MEQPQKKPLLKKTLKEAIKKDPLALSEARAEPQITPDEPRHRIDIGEAVAEAIRTLDKGDIKKFSFVTKEEEMLYALYLTLAETHDLKFLRKFVYASLCLRVSIEGKGRDDIVRIASAHVTEEQQQRGFFGRLSGRMGF